MGNSFYQNLENDTVTAPTPYSRNRNHCSYATLLTKVQKYM